jgi:hypothetical protein
MSEFTYNQYPFKSKSQIRLLELTHSASCVPQWSFTQPITISGIIETNTENHFAALSYEWGSPEDTGPFVLDGKEVVLRRNLIDFLHALPELRKDQNLPAAFWVDSICINQDDPKEKVNQIRLLREIYSSASSVVSWLGPMRDGSNLAMKYLRDINIDAGNSVNLLLNRRYWMRLWMVQEVVLAKKWYIACGSDIIHGHYVTRLFISPKIHSSRRSFQWRESRAYNLISERSRFEAHGPLVLIDLMLLFYQLDSEFKVDRIRALLALSRPDSIGNTHELLTHLVDSAGDPDQTKIAISDICEEMCRLAQLDIAWKDARSKDIKSFGEGVLTNGMEKQSLMLIAERLRCSRMFMKLMSPADSQLFVDGTHRKLPPNEEQQQQDYQDDPNTASWSPSNKEQQQDYPDAPGTVNWLPSHLAQSIFQTPGNHRTRETASACQWKRVLPSHVTNQRKLMEDSLSLEEIEEVVKNFRQERTNKERNHSFGSNRLRNSPEMVPVRRYSRAADLWRLVQEKKDKLTKIELQIREETRTENGSAWDIRRRKKTHIRFKETANELAAIETANKLAAIETELREEMDEKYRDLYVVLIFE